LAAERAVLVDVMPHAVHDDRALLGEPAELQHGAMVVSFEVEVPRAQSMRQTTNHAAASLEALEVRMRE
jgi:hypothetical protein